MRRNASLCPPRFGAGKHFLSTMIRTVLIDNTPECDRILFPLLKITFSTSIGFVQSIALAYLPILNEFDKYPYTASGFFTTYRICVEATLYS